MTVQFQEIQEALGIDIPEDLREKAKGYYRLRSILLTLALVAIGLTVLSAIFVRPLRNIAVGVTFLIIFASYLYWVRSFHKTVKLLMDSCNPQAFLPAYMALLERAGERADWRNHFYYLILALVSADRQEDAESVLEIFSRNCKDTGDLFSYELAACMTMYAGRDSDKLAGHIAALTRVRAKVNATAEREDLYAYACQLGTMDRILENKDYQMGFDAFTDIEDKGKKKMAKDASSGKKDKGFTPKVGDHEKMLYAVMRNYFIWQLAVEIAYTYSESRYGDFVLDKGGTTCYRARVQAYREQAPQTRDI